MKQLSLIFTIALILCNCSAKNRFPDPYQGFEHRTAEHGYWKEITKSKDSIEELHLHSKGISITYNPFETYKDYWGAYDLREQKTKIHLTVAGGNRLPDFKEVTGNFTQIGSDLLTIKGIALDYRRPGKKNFRFQRFHPNQ